MSGSKNTLQHAADRVFGGWRRGLDASALTTLALCTMLTLSSATAGAQSYDPRAPGLILHVQAGFNWSTLTDVSSIQPDQSLENRRSSVLSLRATYVLPKTPVAGFLEISSAQRGARLRQTGAPTDLIRSRYFDLGGGFNVALRCVAGVCPSIDAGGTLGYHRETLRLSGQTGSPTEVIPSNRWETSALGGVRLAVQRFRGVAVSLRRVEGLSQLPTDGTTARNRSTMLLFSLPLTQ